MAHLTNQTGVHTGCLQWRDMVHTAATSHANTITENANFARAGPLFAPNRHEPSPRGHRLCPVLEFDKASCGHAGDGSTQLIPRAIHVQHLGELQELRGLAIPPGCV